MNTLYPYTSPIIINDDVFSLYGGNFGSTTPEKRQVAYLLAEMKATEGLGTFLKPTIITGTFQYQSPLVLDYAYVHQIYQIEFINSDGEVYYTDTGTYGTYYALRDDEYAIVDIDYLLSLCGCRGTYTFPYQLRVSYQAGLPTGTSMLPTMLLALETAADIFLNEIIGYGNEAPGDIGIQSFTNQSYREERIGLYWTMFGSSPRAIFASELLSGLKKRRFVGI